VTKGKNKTILLISSHVVRGSVGSRGSVFTLERMGFEVWSLFTVTMTWQPRHGVAHQLVISEQDFAKLCDDIATSPHASEIDAVMTGYFAHAPQVSHATRLITKLKQARPDILFFCDPVMGDEGGLYIAPETAQAIKAELLPLADIIKPNRSELEWLSGKKFGHNADIIAALANYQAKIKLVTSAFSKAENATGNLLIDGNQAWLAEHPQVLEPVNGLGDLTASLFFSHILQGMDTVQALGQASASVFDCLNHALASQSNELLLARSQDFFSHPTSSVTVSAL